MDEDIRKNLPDGLKIILVNADRLILASNEVMDDAADFGPKERAKLFATFERYVEVGPGGLPKERLNRNEGRHVVSGRGIQLQAFKADAVRIYGVEASYAGRRAFVLSMVSIKKRKRAKQAVLKQAALKAVQLLEVVEEQNG